MRLLLVEDNQKLAHYTKLGLEVSLESGEEVELIEANYPQTVI